MNTFQHPIYFALSSVWSRVLWLRALILRKILESIFLFIIHCLWSYPLSVSIYFPHRHIPLHTVIFAHHVAELVSSSGHSGIILFYTHFIRSSVVPWTSVLVCVFNLVWWVYLCRACMFRAFVCRWFSKSCCVSFVLRVALLHFTFPCMFDFLSYVSAHACMGCRSLEIIVCIVVSPCFNFVYTLSFRLLCVC